MLKVRFLQGANYKEDNSGTGMASKKKIKQKKSNAASDNGHKSSGQPQKMFARTPKASQPGEPHKGKVGNNPAKSTDETSNTEPAKGAIQRKGGYQLLPQFVQISQFLNEVLTEFRKINWPERSQVARETVSVLFLVLLITILVWIFDLVVGKFVFAPLEHLGHLYGIGANK